MASNRRRTEDEDRAIRRAAALNKAAGAGAAGVVAAIGIGGRGRQRAVADAFGRTYGAVLTRAVRLGPTSR